MHFGTSGNVHDHQKHVLDFGPTKFFKMIQEQIQEHFWEILCSEIPTSQTSTILEKRVPDILGLRLINS